MLFILYHVIQCPVHALLKIMLSYRAIFLITNMALKIKTAIAVYKQFERLPKLSSYEFCQDVNFFMRLVHVQIPGYCKVAIEVKDTAVFDHAQVVEVHPVPAPVLFEFADHFV